jgi:putative transposase
MQSQLPLTFRGLFSHGGPRPGAGRPKSGRPVGVRHRLRPTHHRDHPVHITLRVRRELPNLRDTRPARAIGNAIRAHTQSNPNLRVVHFSIQTTHIHMLVESHDKLALSRGLQGLTSRIARRLNHELNRRGPVFADRYHARAIASPREARNAIVYVLLNYKHHVQHARGIDVCSSGRWWNGWLVPPLPPDTPNPTAEPATWLLRAGWKRHGRIGSHEAPAGTPADAPD